MPPQVELYVQPGCGDCRHAEEFLRRMGVEFTAYDVRRDPDAYDRLVHRYQSRVTATVVIGGKVFRGFGRNRAAIERALREAGVTGTPGSTGGDGQGG